MANSLLPADGSSQPASIHLDVFESANCKVLEVSLGEDHYSMGGKYHLCEELVSGRVCYQKEGSDKGKWTIRWVRKLKQWVIDPRGYEEPLALAEVKEDVEHPLQISKVWKVFDHGVKSMKETPITIEKCSLENYLSQVREALAIHQRAASTEGPEAGATSREEDEEAGASDQTDEHPQDEEEDDDLCVTRAKAIRLVIGAVICAIAEAGVLIYKELEKP